MTPESDALLTAAESKLKAAELLFNAGMNGDAVSRAYHAVFHAISALHLASGNSFSIREEQLKARLGERFRPVDPAIKLTDTPRHGFIRSRSGAERNDPDVRLCPADRAAPYTDPVTVGR